MFRIGIDTGGTFTDLVVIEDHGMSIKRFKTPSTPQDYSEGVLNALNLAAKNYKMEIKSFLKKVELIIHGTTIATNLILSKSGKDVGLITTKGFRDIIEQWYKEERRYDMRYPPPNPPCPRWLRLEVEERIDFSGKVIKQLKEEDIKKAISFYKKNNINSIAVSLLFSPINPDHEIKIFNILKKDFDEISIHLSSEILPQLREYERTMATILNAYVAPYSSRYLSDLNKKLKLNGYENDLLIMQSNSGISSIKTISKIPIRLALSGPASGPKAGLFFSKTLKEKNIISIDMGGTSFDVCLIKGGVIPTTTDGYIGRFRLALPAVDIHSLGAGGGSIAWVDQGGILRVGPKSAGAVPGPACYGQGGKNPTVTDADLILGYINPNFFLGGRMKLDIDLAKSAMNSVSKKLNLNLEETAQGIINVVNNNMIDGIRTVSVKKGYDPKNFTLVAAGGAGPVHAVRLAELANISNVIVPRTASAFCAFGMVISDLRHDYVKPYIIPIKKSDPNILNSFFKEMELNGKMVLNSEHKSNEDIEFVRSIDMRYIGQIYEVETRIPNLEITEKNIQEIEELFHKKHEQLYGHFDKNSDIEIVHLRLKAFGRKKSFSLIDSKLNSLEPSKQVLKPNRKVFFEESKGFIDCNIYNGELLVPGNLIEGPAVIEEPDTTILVFPSWKCNLDKYNNYLLTQNQIKEVRSDA